MAGKKENQEEEVTKVPKKKRGLLKWGVLALIIVALGAGGYVGWQKFFAQNGGKSHVQAKPTKRIVYELDTFLVNLSDPGGRRYLKVNIKLELNDQEVVKEFNRRKFELRDKILMLLSSKRFDDIATLSGKMALKQEIISRLNASLKDGRVEQVYFTDFLVQ